MTAPPTSTHLRPLAAFFLINFVLHLLWENTQAPLFEGYESFAQHFPICLKATVTGDMLFTCIIYLTLTIVYQDWWWLNAPKTYRHPATWLLPIIVGLPLAISFELWAIHVDHRWAYTAMPLIPLLRIGSTPVLQIAIIPLLSLLLAKKFLPSPKPL